MKIISRGIPPSERIWTGECRSCKSVIEALESELTQIEEDQREGTLFSWEEGTRFSWEVCPVCGAGKYGKGNYGGVLFYPRQSK